MPIPTFNSLFSKRPAPTSAPLAILPVGEAPSLTQLQARRRALQIELDGLAGVGWQGDIDQAVARHNRQPFHTAADVEALLRGDRLEAVHSTAVADLQRELRAVTVAIEELQDADDRAEVSEINAQGAEATTLLREVVTRARASKVEDLPRHAQEIRQHVDTLEHLVRWRQQLIRPDSNTLLPPFVHDVDLEAAALRLLVAAEHVAEATKAYTPAK